MPGLTPNIKKLVVEPPRVAAEVEAGVELSGPAQDTTEAEAGAVVQGREEEVGEGATKFLSFSSSFLFNYEMTHFDGDL